VQFCEAGIHVAQLGAIGRCELVLWFIETMNAGALQDFVCGMNRREVQIGWMAVSSVVAQFFGRTIVVTP
jgi:hypothetical protein